jgi:surface polysaccharide O-acyltransferase-like enzyme
VSDRLVPDVPPPRTPTRWMDGARALAALAVVLIHVLAPTVGGQGLDVGSPGWWLADALNSASRWCVPVFVMIAGALALDPARTERPRVFYRKRWHRIGVPLVFWTAFYLGFRTVVLGEPVTLADAVDDVARGAPFLQLYFLYILAGLVALTPFLKVVTRHATWRMQLGMAVVMLVIGVLDQIGSVILGAGEPNAVTRFLPFIGYYVLGYVLRDVLVSRSTALALGAGFALSVVATALAGRTGDFGTFARYAYDFLSPSVVVMSVCGYLLLHRLLDSGGGLLRRAAPLSFGVFLVHAAVLFAARRVLDDPADLAEVALAAVALTAAVTAVSAALTWAWLRVPYARVLLGEPARPRPPGARRPDGPAASGGGVSGRADEVGHDRRGQADQRQAAPRVRRAPDQEEPGHG